MKLSVDCDYCGSAGSIEFSMCQVCLKDFTEAADRYGGEPRLSALAAEVDRIIFSSTLARPPVFTRGDRSS